MKVTVETSTKVKVEEFFEFLKKRASADEHKGNVDIIADFIDKVMVIELKRLQNDPDIFEENFEVPDDVFLEPLKKVKKQFDDVFNGFLKDKDAITTDIEPNGNLTSSLHTGCTDKDLSAEPITQTVPIEPDPVTAPITKSRSGNGHKSLKIRNLMDSERDHIHYEFIALNGCLADADKECTRIKDHLNKGSSQPLSVNQVTGFVSVLHVYVCEGKETVSDMAKYINWMTQKYPAMAARYNSPKMIAKRETQAKLKQYVV